MELHHRVSLCQEYHLIPACIASIKLYYAFPTLCLKAVNLKLATFLNTAKEELV